MGFSTVAQAANNPKPQTVTINRQCTTHWGNGESRTHYVALTYAINNPDTGQYIGMFYPRALDVSTQDNNPSSPTSDWTGFQQTWENQNGTTYDSVGSPNNYVGQPPHSGEAELTSQTNSYWSQWDVLFQEFSIGPNGTRGPAIYLASCVIQFTRN